MTINQGEHIYLYEGSVTRRDDPDNLGRVKILIPGLIEPETPDWVFPIGTEGGSAQRGNFNPPAVGSTVCVLFKLGQIEHPRYIHGPWGEPDGSSDTPTGAEIEGDKRQVAVTEDEEWLIQRSSKSSGKKYLIKHKSSGQAILIDADAGKIYLTKEAATQALVIGTTYRNAEAQWLSSLLLSLVGVVTALNAFGLDAGFAATYPALVATLNGLAATLSTAITNLGNQDMANDITAYLSTEAFTE
jgi:hypothetical protein